MFAVNDRIAIGVKLAIDIVKYVPSHVRECTWIGARASRFCVWPSLGRYTEGARSCLTVSWCDAFQLTSQRLSCRPIALYPLPVHDDSVHKSLGAVNTDEGNSTTQHEGRLPRRSPRIDYPAVRLLRIERRNLVQPSTYVPLGRLACRSCLNRLQVNRSQANR